MNSVQSFCHQPRQKGASRRTRLFSFEKALFGLLLAFALLWAMLVVGRPDYAPVLGQASGIAADT